jgi:arginine exporter protein ArgO
MRFSRGGGILPYIPRHCKSGRLGSSALAEPVVNAIVKWMGIVLLIGIALMYIEYRFAKKKKEGVTATDRKRIVGIFWLTIFFSALVGGIMFFAD